MYSYLDTPLDPNGDYTEQEKELERQRQLAIALYKNVIGGANENAQSGGRYNGLVAMLGQIIGATGLQKNERDFAERQSEIDRNKTAAERKFYTSMPSATPGRPEVDIPAYATGLPPWAVGADNATGDVPVQSAMLPHSPTPKEYNDWSATAPQTRQAQLFAEKMRERMLPMSPDVAYQKEQDRVIKRADLQRKADQALMMSEDKSLSLEKRDEWHNRYYSYLEDMGQAGLDVRRGQLKVAEGNLALRQQQTGGLVMGDPDKTGKEYLDSLSLQQRETLKALDDGRLNINTFSQRTGERRMWAGALLAYNAGANPTAAPGVQKDFTSGKTSNNIRSVNTALSHIGIMDDLVDALQNNSGPPVLNSLFNTLSKNIEGAPQITDFNTARLAVSSELMRAFREVGADVTEIKEWQDKFSSSNTPEQLKGALRVAGELLAGRIKNINDTYIRGTGKKEGFPDIISPENLDTLKQLGIKNFNLNSTGVGQTPAPPAAPLRDNFLPGTDLPGMAEYFQQQKNAGKTTPEIGGGMLPQIGGKTVVKRKVLPDGRTAVLYSDGTDGFE